MKANHICYENYPWQIVAVANVVNLAIYASGAIIVVKLGLLPLFLYLAYLVILEVRLLKVSCTKCFYYDQYCAFGKGKLSALFFKKDDPSLFGKRNFTWYSMIPDMLVSVIPILIGIYLLISDFNWIILSMMIILIVLTSFGNGMVRGSLACNHCKQKEIRCPADQLFNQPKKHKV